MKTTKKRFKGLLADVQQSASELRLLSSQLTILDDARQVADRVLVLCEALGLRASELHRTGFAEQMLEDQRLCELDEIADVDLISVLERRMSKLSSHDRGEGELVVFMGQLLDKLEAGYAAMVENIQQLTAVLTKNVD
ncbi:MAG: hypothetical protein ACU836_08535 [Gammaproteobacteria bacterium]